MKRAALGDGNALPARGLAWDSCRAPAWKEGAVVRPLRFAATTTIGPDVTLNAAPDNCRDLNGSADR